VSDGTVGDAASVGDAVGRAIVGGAVALATGAGVVMPKLKAADGCGEGPVTDTQPTRSDAKAAQIPSALDNVDPPSLLTTAEC